MSLSGDLGLSDMPDEPIMGIHIHRHGPHWQAYSLPVVSKSVDTDLTDRLNNTISDWYFTLLAFLDVDIFIPC